MRGKLMSPIVSLAVALAACGSSSSSAPSGQPRQWAESDIVRLSGLRRNADFSYRLVAHPACATPTLLRSTAEVETYKAAGDILATNGDRSAGAVVDGQSAACQRLFRQAFARVR